MAHAEDCSENGHTRACGCTCSTTIDSRDEGPSAPALPR